MTTLDDRDAEGAPTHPCLTWNVHCPLCNSSAALLLLGPLSSSEEARFRAEALAAQYKTPRVEG